jgi:HD superfamily phosphohydrolase
MIYKDRIYGKVNIEEPVILDLIKCPSLQRMKGVDQHGHFEPHFPGTAYNRFEHSLGVYILLKKFGVPLLEQIAGLLHDVSHTVFSHVADYIYGSGSGEEQNFQDKCHQEFIENSEIPKILKKYKINYKEILDDEKFLLKERELPELCADRIDYFLRELCVTKKATLKEIREFINNFVIIDNFWVFRKKDLAKKYTYSFLEMNNWFWSGIQSAVMFKTTAELLKYALKKKIINKNDLFTTDEEVWRKIRPIAKKDKKLKFLIERADNEIKYKLSSKDNYDLYAQSKSRVVDPLFLQGKSLKRVSEIDSKFLKLKKKHSKPKEYYIKFEE